MKKTAMVISACALLWAAACSDEATTPDAGPTADGTPPSDIKIAWGEEGGPCYPNDTCNAGLKCVKGKCVDPNKPDGSVPPKDLPQPPKDLPQPPKDGPVVPPKDGPVVPPKDGPVVPPKDGPGPTTCTPPGQKKLMYRYGKVGDWTVALEMQSNYKAITISGAKAKEDVASFDYNVNWQQVAGFAVSRGSAAKLATAEATAAMAAIGKGVYGTVTTIDSGLKVKTHDGFDGVALTTLEIKLASTSDVSLVRNLVAAALLGVKTSSLSNLPLSFGAPSTTFVVRFGTVIRKDARVVFVGSVTDKSGDSDASKVSRIVARDLANTTGLAQANRQVGGQCDSFPVTKPLTPVDIIWVMDESGSMSTERAAIAANAAKFFTAAKNAGLDFRMGVTNVCNPSGSWKGAVGKFCSKISTNTNDDGGVDRFLLPTEANIFAACINNPPGFEGGSEYGLLNAKEAVDRHLPRAASSAAKIRKGAQVVIIVVTDEVPVSMLSPIGSGNVNKCTLPAANQANLDKALKPTLDYFKGIKDPETKVNYFHAIAGVCKNTCQAQVAHGYNEVAKAFNGKVYDVCAKDLSAGITQIINGILTTSSQIVLKHKPISGSLRVAVNKAVVPRSLLKGFDYKLATNSLTFISTTVGKGSTVVASYTRWK